MSAASDEVQQPDRYPPDLLLFPIRRLRFGGRGIAGFFMGLATGWALLFLSWPIAFSNIFMNFILFCMAILFLLGGPFEIVSVILRYPRIELKKNILSFRGLLFRKTLNLDTLGKANISQSGRIIFLSFFGRDEEQAFRSTYNQSKPNAFTQKASIPILAFVGRDLAEAQKLADRINSLRPPYTQAPSVGKGRDSDSVLQNVKRRNWWAHIVLFVVIMMISVICGFARSHHCRGASVSQDGIRCVVYADVIKKMFAGD